MARKKILWLCSWYPSRSDPFDGDFIQRHARAAALYNDIFVIHVHAYPGRPSKGPVIDLQGGEGLIEEVTSFSKSLTPWGRLIGHSRLLRYYRQAITRYVQQMGKPDLVHVQVPIWAGAAARWLKKKKKIPFLLTEHWGIYNEIERHNYRNKSSRFKKYSRKIFSEASGFTSVSRYLAEGVSREVVRKPFTLIPNVVDTAQFYFDNRSGSPFRFIHVSNMVPLKNVEGILHAFRGILNKGVVAELIMVGNRDNRQQEIANSLGLTDTVQFRGEIPYREVAQEMQRAACLVLFSHIENSPCVISEALCCGLPVIATRVGGIPELVNDTNGILVEAADEIMLGEAMERMIGNYSIFDRPAIAEEAGARFNYQVVGRKFDELYADILAGNQTGLPL